MISYQFFEKSASTAGMNKKILRSNLLRWEIGIALLLKIILLTGLWFLVFRWEGKPKTKPDIVARFALQNSQSGQSSVFITHPTKESVHVR